MKKIVLFLIIIFHTITSLELKKELCTGNVYAATLSSDNSSYIISTPEGFLEKYDIENETCQKINPQCPLTKILSIKNFIIGYQQKQLMLFNLSPFKKIQTTTLDICINHFQILTKKKFMVTGLDQQQRDITYIYTFNDLNKPIFTYPKKIASMLALKDTIYHFLIKESDKFLVQKYSASTQKTKTLSTLIITPNITADFISLPTQKNRSLILGTKDIICCYDIKDWKFENTAYIKDDDITYGLLHSSDWVYRIKEKGVTMYKASGKTNQQEKFTCNQTINFNNNVLNKKMLALTTQQQTTLILENKVRLKKEEDKGSIYPSDNSDNE